MKKLSIIFTSMLLLAITNCIATGPTHGLIFTSNTFPGEFNTVNDVKATKKGEGCQHRILNIITFGDAGAGSTAKENKILRIATIDHSTLSVLTSLYMNYCTIVYGE